MWEQEIPATSGGVAQERPRPSVPPPADVQGLLRRARIERSTTSRTAERAAALSQSVYVDTRSITGDQELHSALVALVRAPGFLGEEQTIDERAVGRIAEKIGMPPEVVRGAILQERTALEDRVRGEALAGTRGLGKAVSRGLGHAMVGAVLRWSGLGIAASIPRIAEALVRNRAVEQETQARLVELKRVLEGADAEATSGPLRDLLDRTAAGLAFEKQRQLDAGTQEHEERARVRGVRGIGDLATSYQDSVRTYLQSQREGERLSDADIDRLSYAAARLYIVSEQSAAMEHGIMVPEGLLRATQKLLPHSETQSGRVTKAAVFAVAGVLARGTPIIGDLLIAYSGAKLGKAAGVLATETLGKKRYQELREITPEERRTLLEEKTVDGALLTRARLRLLDRTFARNTPAEYQLIREAVERHTANLLLQAKEGVDSVRIQSNALMRDLDELRGKKRERAWMTNVAGAAGAVAALFLKDVIVEFMGRGSTPAEHAAATGGTAEPPATAAIAEAPPAAAEPPATAEEFGAPSEVLDGGEAPAAGLFEKEATPVAAEAVPVVVPEVEAASAEPSASMMDLATVQAGSGEGVTHAIARQLLAEGDARHAPMSVPEIRDITEKHGSLPRWAVLEARKIAIANGIIDPKSGTEYRLGARDSGTFLLGPSVAGTRTVDWDPSALRTHNILSSEELLRGATEQQGPLTAEDQQLEQEVEDLLSRVGAPEPGTPSAPEDWVAWEEAKDAAVESDAAEVPTIPQLTEKPEYRDFIAKEFLNGSYDRVRAALVRAHPDWSPDRVNFNANAMVITAQRLERDADTLDRVLASPHAEHLLRGHRVSERFASRWEQFLKDYPKMLRAVRVRRIQGIVDRMRIVLEDNAGTDKPTS
ncbi:hypothetical protein HY480_00905 [Candidatus Uhrbacteria bacterium]|nr:hypothetical protein [Candidatus Uhrbacteria bacterium]